MSVSDSSSPVPNACSNFYRHVFKKFMNEEGKFNDTLVTNVEGMLSLYEAAHFRIHGEDILDEAIAFTYVHLKLMSTKLSVPLVAQINNSLKRSLLKSLPRLVAKHYISIYEEHPSHDKNLLLFAKLDFNMLQKQHQREVGNVSRWDISCINFLPEYMKFCYQALLDVFKEIEQEMDKEGRSFCTIYAKNEMKRLVQAYFAEAKWLNNNYTPTMEEYMAVAQASSGYRMVTVMAFVGMGCIATEKDFQWFSDNPKIIDAATKISRLMDDIVSNEFEQKREHVVSALECYMKQHGVTKEEAINELYKKVTHAWKDINEELLDPTKVSRPLLTTVLNLSRVMDVLYKDGDGYTHSDRSTKNDIIALLLNSYPI
ncbi:hypothetical protein VNO77_37305 [Canavalia gladiata]|uniref:(+)-delta-cadinene synthase n=1 Tax=Canavalia gladiata TaxID=3824 RepID=A0AAN9PYD0_CANGL